MVRLLSIEEQGSHHERDGRQHFYEHVEGWPRRVLEGIAHRVSGHRGLVRLAALAAVRPRLDVFFGVDVANFFTST